MGTNASDYAGCRDCENLPIRKDEIDIVRCQVLKSDVTYKYIVTQETGSDSNTTYDKTVYNADVYVTENDSGVMNAETIVYKNGSDNKLPECNFTNTVNIALTPADGSNSDIGASEKSGSSSTTSGINTGVITHEAFYAMAGLFGITVMLITAKKRRKNWKQ